MSDLTVANTILQQMGGAGRLSCMLGATNFASSGGNALSFKFKMCKAVNYIKITLNSMDTYDVEFGKIWGSKYTVKKTETYVYCDQLKGLFEKTTGLYLSL